MRSARFGLLSCVLLLNLPVWGQQASQQNPMLPTLLVPKPPDDPQALDVLGRALNAAGGASAVSAIKDYTASGTVTYHWGGKDVEGTVTLSGRGSDQFRMDSSLPTGTRSWAASRGNASEKAEDGTISQVRGFSLLSPSCLIFPYLQLAITLNQKAPFTASHLGLVEVDGHSAHDIRVRTVIYDGPSQKSWASEIGALDFFVDASTFQVLMTRDMARPSRNSAGGPPHEIRFGDYRAMNGVLIPYTISESIASQQTWVIHLDKMAFNTGLVDSNFQF
jgi:hypothetical protein